MSEEHTAGRLRPSARNVGLIGPVNGMNEMDPEGSYFRLVTWHEHQEDRRECLISRGAAGELLTLLQARLKPRPPPHLEEVLEVARAVIVAETPLDSENRRQALIGIDVALHRATSHDPQPARGEEGRS